MKTNLPLSKAVIALLLLIITELTVYSQTAGTLSFSVTTTSSGGYTPKHLLAIWLQNNNTSGSSSGFIKTKIRYSSTGNLDHLGTWDASSGRSVVDAATGATLTSHGTITFLWNGTNVAGTVVPDGTYYAWLEMAWDDPIPGGKTVNSYAFTKGTSVFNSTPANTANFLSLSLTWNPTTTAIPGILESENFNVYPNPSSGLLNINFKHPEKECYVRIANESGLVTFQEKITDIQSGVKTFDLSHLPSGTYFCTLHFPDKDVVFTVILSK